MEKGLIERVRLDLDNSTMLNMFGLVNLARVRACNEIPNGVTDEELRRTIKKLFDEDVHGGVQFMKSK